MNVKYNPADMAQVYFKALQDALTILVSLQDTVADKVLILQAIDQFNKHMDLNEAIDDWKKIVPQKTWKKFKMHFTKAVTKNQKRSGTLREIGIANQVKDQVETNRDNTENVAKFQIEQEEKIEELTARMAQLENTKPPTGQAYGAQGPSVLTPPSRSDDMRQITTILQAVLEAQARTPEGETKGNGDSFKTKRKWNKTAVICLMPSAQNAATHKTTHTATHTSMTFPTNTTAIHASGKRRDTKMRQQSRTKWEV